MKLFISFLIAIASFNSLAVNENNQSTKNSQKRFETILNWDLLLQQRLDTKNKTPQAIEKMNEDELKFLNQYKPVNNNPKRAISIDMNLARKLVDSIEKHPVVSSWGSEKYQQKDVKIGFCFGRAAYAHLMLLKLGVQNDSIKKMWAVGPMTTGSTDWQFHVTTIVRRDDGEWITIDDFVGEPMTVKEWIQEVKALNPQKNLRFYFSEPEKFSVALRKYDRIQLGLDLSKQQDWYKGYFQDLMASMESVRLEDLGLYSVKPKK